ncbi:MAG: sulfite exporter TauE/SafE family protein [Alistipes sp.]|nr:sulfite exporter TauE/SafE family protein [Alistipes sp.]
MMDWHIAVALLLSGTIVGIINTLAGGGSIITMTMFMAFGLPINIANGTNRVAVLLQNLTATLTFIRKKSFNVSHGLLLSLPVIVGNVAGSLVASYINEWVFKICFGVILLVIMLYLLLDSRIHIKEGHSLEIKPLHYLWFFLIGFYGGYIYIGIGYLILAVTLWVMRMDLVTANAIKGFVILLATPFSLAVFMIMGNVDYTFGIVHGVGNMIGSFLASHYMAHWGKTFIKVFMAIVVAICFCDLIGVISLHDLFYSLLAIEG